MTNSDRPVAVPANPEQWSEKSKQSVAYEYTREYRDLVYTCRHCKAESVFTAQEQRYTFEVKKASIDQRRALCSACWCESLRIRAALRECEAQWATGKAQLRFDKQFLSRWSDLLLALDPFIPYNKVDIAKKNMLAKLLANA